MVCVSTCNLFAKGYILLIAIVGGGLQGLEVAYLSKKAGWEIMVLDKASDAPAKGLADTFIQIDICQIKRASFHLEQADLVLPALENYNALQALHLWQKISNIPVCFDLKAYTVSSSKQKSNALFSRLNIPRPLGWPQCGFPVVVKPSNGSGSQGVHIISSKAQRPKFFDTQYPKDQWVVEEYINGPSYSLEIVGTPDRYETLQVTELLMDENYNCKRVIAPAFIELDLVRLFEQSAKTIAHDMKLNGIMDFEVILHKGEMKMLEIDARFPSQTPMAVYASTGVNMFEILANLALHQKLDSSFLPEKPDHAIVEHINVCPQGIALKGETIMKTCGPLHLETGFWGADEAVTSFVPGCSSWVATLIIKGKTSQETWEKRNQILKELSHRSNLPLLPDINPYDFS